MYAGVPIDVPICVSVASGRRRPRGADRLRDSEIGDDRGAAREQHVVRLDVAMHDAALVRVAECLRHVLQNADDFGDRERAAREARAQRLAFDERHRVERQSVRVAGGQDRDDVRLLKRGDRLDLALEPLGAQPCARSGDSTFTTTLRPSRSSSATNTRLMPPPPSSRSNVVGVAERGLQLGQQRGTQRRLGIWVGFDAVLIS